ncbi:MAG: tripartite tricarboxylate transporter substrate binding protein [Betaproteobacteria bacterium]|nr:tripartite tricarboxylate transporter substrate binding protein [Betaproteobacteria bacterium]
MLAALRTVVLLCASLCACVVHAQAWPTKPVRWLIPFPAGQGASDITARVLTEKLAGLWGQSIVVENKPGAGGTIATAEMLKSPADGYTIMSGTMGTHTIAPNLYKGLPFDAARDLIPVSLIVDVPLVLVASTQVPANTLRDFVALTKDNPGKYAYASPGNGTLNHVMGELLKQAAKSDMPHIPYKGGAGAYADMYSGAVAVMFDPILSATTQVKQGKLKAYAIASPKRSPALPDVPTRYAHGRGQPDLYGHRNGAEEPRSASEARGIGRRSRRHAARGIFQSLRARPRALGKNDQGTEHQDRLTKLRACRRLPGA